MMQRRKSLGTGLAIAALLVALSGCQKQEGPAERAGKSVDNAVDKVGQQVEKAGDKIQDAAKSDK